MRIASIQGLFETYGIELSSPEAITRYSMHFMIGGLKRRLSIEGEFNFFVYKIDGTKLSDKTVSFREYGIGLHDTLFVEIILGNPAASEPTSQGGRNYSRSVGLSA